MEHALWFDKQYDATKIALDYKVESKIRKASINGELRCPEPTCQNPILIYRHGEKKSPHFSHQKNTNCSYANFDKSNAKFHNISLLIYYSLRNKGIDVEIEKKILDRF